MRHGFHGEAHIYRNHCCYCGIVSASAFTKISLVIKKNREVSKCDASPRSVDESPTTTSDDECCIEVKIVVSILYCYITSGEHVRAYVQCVPPNFVMLIVNATFDVDVDCYCPWNIA